MREKIMKQLYNQMCIVHVKRHPNEPMPTWEEFQEDMKDEDVDYMLTAIELVIEEVTSETKAKAEKLRFGLNKAIIMLENFNNMHGNEEKTTAINELDGIMQNNNL